MGLFCNWRHFSTASFWLCCTEMERRVNRILIGLKSAPSKVKLAFSPRDLSGGIELIRCLDQFSGAVKCLALSAGWTWSGGLSKINCCFPNEKGDCRTPLEAILASLLSSNTSQALELFRPCKTRPFLSHSLVPVLFGFSKSNAKCPIVPPTLVSCQKNLPKSNKLFGFE